MSEAIETGRKKLLFVFNPTSGRGLIRGSLIQILNIFTQAGYEITIHPTQDKEDAFWLISKEAHRYDRVVCSGGDGTLDEVVCGILEGQAHVPVGYIPAGTTNDFAQSLGITKNMEQSAEVAVSDRFLTCDIGQFNQSYFVYVAAFGIFTDVSYETNQNVKNVLGYGAYLMEGTKHVKEILAMPAFHMCVEANGETIEGDFIYGMISNSVSVAGLKNLTGDDVLLDDGCHEVMLIKKPMNPRMVQDLVGGLVMSRRRESEMIISFKASQVHITSREPVPWTLDGEYGGEHTEVNFLNLCRAVTFTIKERKDAVKNDENEGA